MQDQDLDAGIAAANDAQRQRFANNPVIPNASSAPATTPVSSAARDLDSGIAASSAAQRRYFARHTVIPSSDSSSGGIISSAAASTGSTPSTPSGQPRVSDAANDFYGSEAVPPGEPGGSIGKIDPLGAVNNFFRPNSVSAQSYRLANNISDRDITVDASATRTRPMVGQEEVNTDRVGPVTAAANAAPDTGILPEGITRVGNSYTGTGTPPAPSIVRPDFVSDAARVTALDAANQETRYMQGQRFSNQQQAGVDLERARGEARVANFLAKNGADVVLGSNPIEKALAAKRYGAVRDAANATLAEAQKQYNATGAALASPTGRNYVQEAVAQEQSRLAGQQGQIAAAEAGQKQQFGQLQLQHQQRINDISSRLISETDPKKIASLQQSLLTLLGKNEIGRYDVKVVPGGTRFDPNNSTMPIKDPDRVVVYDKYGQEPPHILETGQGQSAPPPKAQALSEARAFVAKNPGSKDAVNARLKAWGYETI